MTPDFQMKAWGCSDPATLLMPTITPELLIALACEPRPPNVPRSRTVQVIAAAVVASGSAEGPVAG